MKKIFVYSGKWAYQAKDVENFLSVFDLEYQRVCEHEISSVKGNPKQKIFIVPGGKISDYLPAWGAGGIDLIKKFVRNGGVYIGICAGAYVAGEKFNGVSGLNFYGGEITHKKHCGIIKVKNRNGKIIELISENGSDFSEIKEGKILLKDAVGKIQALEIKIGKGKAILFSSHPEGSIYYNKYPKKFSGALYFNNLLRKI